VKLRPPNTPAVTTESAAGFVTTWSSTWDDEPLSVEKLFADEHYRRWARGWYGDQAIGRLMLAHRRQLCEKRGIKYSRDAERAKIARLFGIHDNQLKVTIDRSAKSRRKRS